MMDDWHVSFIELETRLLDRLETVCYYYAEHERP